MLVSRPGFVFVASMAIASSLVACRDEAGPEQSTEGPATEGATTGATSIDTEGSGETVGNHPPPTPVLTSPPDGAVDQPVDLELCWTPVEDPDGDPVRYRVFVNDFELEQGELGELGHAGPCLGPLAFNPEQTYVWTVQAFAANDPDSTSDKATPFWFTTASDDFTQTVFEDTFDEDRGWAVEGDALTGAWVRGNPVMTVHDGQIAQPDDCAGGQSCYFTGQNPDAIVVEEDVSEGTTALVSPDLDLAPFENVTVTLSRFFYKSELDETGASFRVELLVPDAAEPGGYHSFVLEQLELAEEVEGANAWMPTEYVGCGLPMRSGSRLRISATDVGDGIVEAAIDSVVVTGHTGDAVCNEGVGSVCDPKAADACGPDLLCCPRGTINRGVYRCAEPVASLDYANPPPDPASPKNGPLGCDAPDLFVEPQGIALELDTIYVENDPQNDYYCALLEGCLSGTGMRTVLRFDTKTPNKGSRDVKIGVPANHPDLFHFSACHMHYHFDGYAAYRLLDPESKVVASGHKQAFCLLDWESWAWPGSAQTYSCFNQGISVGWEDVYGFELDCQWIDVTDVSPGDYLLEITVNPPAEGNAAPTLVERDYTNNVVTIPVTL